MENYIDVENLQAPLYFGNGANRSKIDTDGNISLEQSARVTREIAFSLLGSKLGLPAGKVAYDYDNNCLIFNPSGNILVQNDRVIGNILHQHDVDPSGGITPIIRYVQTSSDNTEFTMQFRGQAGGSAPGSTWVEITADTENNSVFPYTGTDIIQHIRFDTIPITDPAGTVIQGRMARTDANVGDINACFIGLEYIKNRLGD